MTSAARLTIAASMLAAAVLCWMGAGVADDLAVRHERAATLHFDPIESRPAWKRVIERLLDADAPAHAGMAAYWTGRYDELETENRRDASTSGLLTDANAAFRRAQQESTGGQPSVEHLDRALQAYANVLRNGGFDRDAAFNYEYVARLRDAAAQAKPAPRASPAPPTPPVHPSVPDDLPQGPTIHGRPGTHPPATRGEDFEVLTPMDYGDREAQPEPTPGRPLPRKG